MDGKEAVAQTKKVAIIGAGVAGLQLAERLLSCGIKQLTIFEKASTVGGVWRENYADFSLQVPKELYEFPAFPYPKSKDGARFPAGHVVQEYIKSFARRFDLNKLVRFSTAVIGLDSEPRVSVNAYPVETHDQLDLTHGWLVTHAPTSDMTSTTQERFDFVVVATGMYGRPNMPRTSGREDFEGEVLHSSDFKNREAACGKRVVVVGGGKSAIDCAVASVKGGAEHVTLLYREAHWPVPRYLLNQIPIKYATYSRLGQALLPTHYDVSAFVWWLHALFTPIKWLVWRLVELLIRIQFHLPQEMVPSSRLEIDVFCGGQILTYEARDMIRAGSLKTHKGAIGKLTAKGIDLQQSGEAGGGSIGCDLIVCGTGFSKSYDYLDTTSRSKLQLEKDGLYLYRSMIPVELPGLAFLGSEISTFNNILTHGLQAAWLSKVLAGELALPPIAQMQTVVEVEMNWKRTWMPASSSRAAIQQLHMPKYHDQLVRDMGLNTCRKSNPAFEALLPYNARDYSTIFGVH
mmetsp:Transcript_41081/g.92972  ORF Transcript_41081/g.92972 Transcript_41081/m.92972 type:complete len:517 (-) Transcript_41081:646-2196(-)